MNNTVNNFSDTNWYTLENSIKDGNVIPVIGPDALMVVFEDQDGSKQTQPFYRLVAADLLKTFQVEANPELLADTWALHKAVTAILASESRKATEQGIRREIARLVSHYLKLCEPAESLKALANIEVFSLFVSLTPDNLLETAMALTGNTNQIRVSTFSPRDASETLDKLDYIRQGERGIFQLLGACINIGIGFAMHEEDTLEYLYKLQSDSARRFGNILSELRRRDLLFIGCNFPDWLGRAMLRLANDNRFYAKETQEFLCSSAKDAGLNAFLTHYSPNTLAFDGQPDEFIAKLADSFGTFSPAPKTPTVQKPRFGSGPTVFVSYASENGPAAKNIANTLLNLGFSDVWFDKKKLKGGDDWSDRIVEAINKTDFFIPILSKEADNRREGVFWDEWQSAIERSRRIKDTYLLPVGIDSEPASKSRYQRISDGDTAVFFDKHLIHAPDGNLSADDCDALRERCRRFMEKANG
jgi:TIR domain